MVYISVAIAHFQAVNLGNLKKNLYEKSLFSPSYGYYNPITIFLAFWCHF